MKVDKNGYRSEKRDAFATAMEVLLALMFGVVVVIAAVMVYALLSGCGGGGSGNGEPVYDENGNCLKNCNGNASDGSVYPSGDTSCNGDTCSTPPQYDATTGACEAIKAGKKPPEVCVPQAYKTANCYKYDYTVCEDGEIPCDPHDGWLDIYCVSNKAECGDGYTSGTCSGTPISKECESDKDCSAPCEIWPPEVCWGLPCLLVGKWQCPSGSVMDFTDMEFYDNGDGYCRIHASGDYYYKQGDVSIVETDLTDQKWLHTINDGGNQILVQEDGTDYSFVCTKVMEEE